MSNYICVYVYESKLINRHCDMHFMVFSKKNFSGQFKWFFPVNDIRFEHSFTKLDRKLKVFEQ